ncbi:MAG: type I-MYXAN CRISPR-associated endonuclease Cas1 [Candidatus Hydrogenedentes bacterium]|nr:type I-MYXAN CRISPR-associated endonuclease Cas1 [Candidatus Hydrogenedentota bacterium]
MTSDADTPPLRVMALHALAYCERLFYLEEVEEIRVVDDRVFAGRALHAEIEREEGESRVFEVSSETLGLTGKLDAVRHREGGWVPVEHKRGRARKALTKGADPEAWPSDSLQVSAYGMLLEEALGQPVAEGRVRYHADNKTVRVPLDQEARNRVRAALVRARELRSSLKRPPVTENEKFCVRCSLAPVCLPEEERLAVNPEWEPLRLFPPRDERGVIHVTQPGTRIGKSGDMFVVTPLEGSEEKFPLAEVGAVALHGNVQMSTQAIHLCAANDIAVHWFGGGGAYLAGLASGAGQVQRRLRQYQALADPEIAFHLAGRLAHAKVEGQLRYLLRATRGRPRDGVTSDAVHTMRRALSGIASAESREELRGQEGIAARAWFEIFPNKLLAEGVPEEMRSSGRTRRPPKDRFNAVLSFGYALLHRSVMQALINVGLEPAFGFYHTPRSAAHPLALDLMELFRVPLWDIPLLGSLNRKQWDVKADFMVSRASVWLSDSGRRKAIELYERRLQESWRHPVVGYSLSYARAIELEARLLEKEWTGNPGLFARSRLR